ncbi:MAG: hypothetical protein DRQ61_06990 [Gammaproteobacteria bacterium]|nr:MAG: hypothetical protein DRQ61_06990 [Gammaproteobacteria bacterium]
MKKVLMVAALPLLQSPVLQAEEGMQVEVADTVELESLAVTGKTSQPVLRLKTSPIMSTVIGKKELDKVKFTDPVELLNRIPGISMSRNLRIPRGDKGYTIPLVDGLSVRNPYRGSFGQIEETNTGDMERIEVIMGPGSALYGSNAFGGVINVITREPPEEQENRVWVEAGDHDRLRTGFTTTGTIAETSVGNIGYFLDANYWDIGGYRDNSDDDRKAISGKLVFHPTENSKLWVRGEHLDRNEKEAGSLTQAEFDADPKQNPGLSSAVDSETNSASIGYSLLTDRGEFLSGFSYRHDEGFKITSFGGPSDYDLQDMDFKTQYRHDFFGSDSGIAASLTTGLELVYSTNDTVGYDDAVVVVEEDENIKMFTFAPFTQLDLFLTEKTKVTLGLRYEKVSYDVKDNLDSTHDAERDFYGLSPKIGMTYDISSDHMVFGGVSKGFAPPSDSRMFQGEYENPDLDAEIATNYEIGMRGSFHEQNLSYDVGLYYMDIEDFIVNEYVETVRGRDKYRPVNASEINFRGLEAQLEYQPFDYLHFGISYTYARNKFEDYVDRGVDYSGNSLSSSPEHHINARVSVIPAQNFEIELEMDSISDYYTNNSNDADPDGTYDRDDVFNLRAGYEKGPVELWLSALNLTDEKYATGVSYSTRGGGSRSYSVGDGRTVYFGAALNF